MLKELVMTYSLLLTLLQTQIEWHCPLSHICTCLSHVILKNLSSPHVIRKEEKSREEECNPWFGLIGKERTCEKPCYFSSPLSFPSPHQFSFFSFLLTWQAKQSKQKGQKLKSKSLTLQECLVKPKSLFCCSYFSFYWIIVLVKPHHFSMFLIIHSLLLETISDGSLALTTSGNDSWDSQFPLA